MKTTLDIQIDELEYQIEDLKKKVAALRRERPRQKVEDYTFADWGGGRVPLSRLFGDKSKLILVHNMGISCSYCAMWADGFTGLLPHLTSRASFVVTSPDSPDVQREFAQSRGWNFPMYSAQGTDFIAEMGFAHEKEGLMPGVSVFERAADGSIYRVSRAEFCPGDDFCAVWHFFDLLPEGIDGWEPQFSYDSSLAGKANAGFTQIQRRAKEE
jgi:predicted dithiol-disulfide oxidoreductase (DUF899 family)